jgi:hypothetical protein
MVWWMMNCKGFDRKYSWPNCGNIPKFAWRDWGIPYRTSVCFGVSTHLGRKTRFLLLSDSCGFVDVGRPLWREDGSVVYNCCWSSPAELFSGASPPWLVTVFYCLRFDTPPTWRARSPYLYSTGTGWPSCTPRHWVPFSSFPTIRRATVEVF